MNIKHKKKLIILGGVLAVLIGIYNYYVVSGTWRYKVTVEISTPEGVKSGSTVNEVSNSAARARSKVSLSQGGNPADFRGEAVVVDLGERGKVFSLLVGPKHFYRAFNGMSGPTTAEGIQYFNKIPIGKEAVLDPKYYPMVVTFTDMSDPKSVTLVKGWKFNPQTQKSDPVDRFEELFGEGVSIKEIRLVRTKEPITWGVIQKYLHKRKAVGPYLFVKGK
ncbi:MAG: hypothetical protein HRT94_07255 [Alphaproteobacteria bacterium]|nr:hypothetical protein [Alphaproteobacteria bacterium]